ncbi:hypothetical protein FO519_003043 [Halicephalobus sp. NKZ332]|nr:hypothetical protein FO519_003043 [Halicephalobus sp. NKZ332]
MTNVQTSIFSMMQLLIIFLFLTYTTTVFCVPRHRHRRHLKQLQGRHLQNLREHLKPVEFSEGLDKLHQLPHLERSKLLQKLHNYITKYAPRLVDPEKPVLPGVGQVDENSKVHVQVHVDSTVASKEIQNSIESTKLERLAKEKVEMALTPQYAILKRKKDIVGKVKLP